MVMAPAEGLHQCLCTVSRADRLPGSFIGDALPRRNRRLPLLPRTEDRLGHVFACLLGFVVINLLWAGGMPSSAASCLPQRHLSGGHANFAFVEPERECGPAPFGRHSACTIC